MIEQEETMLRKILRYVGGIFNWMWNTYFPVLVASLVYYALGKLEFTETFHPEIKALMAMIVAIYFRIGTAVNEHVEMTVKELLDEREKDES